MKIFAEEIKTRRVQEFTESDYVKMTAIFLHLQLLKQHNLKLPDGKLIFMGKDFNQGVTKQ